MSSTTFVPRQTLITADWLNEVNDFMYNWKAGEAVDVHYALGIAPSSTNTLLIRQNTTNQAGQGSTVQIQRLVNTDEGLSNPKALRVLTQVNVDTTQTEWAISGELDNYSDTSSSGSTAVSGVSNKYGTGSVFAGHFQAKDHNTYSASTDVTALIGVEINTPAIGVDHPTSNSGVGNRFCMDIIARALNGVGVSAEIGAAIRIRPDKGTTSDGYFRYGLVISEADKGTNPNTIGTAIYINTNGAYGIHMATGVHTTADYSSASSSAFGLLLTGTYTTSAIRINAGERIGLEATNAIKFGWDSGSTSVQFLNSGTNRVALGLAATPVIRMNGTQVLSTRKTGWATASGTATRTTFDTATVTTAELAERVKALIDDLHSTAGHGIIGT